jgi:serine palmitoyltransferase
VTVSDGCVLGTQELVAHLRRSAHGSVYAETMAPPVCQQILTSLRIIMGEDGTADGRRRIEQLAANSLFFRNELKRMGFVVYGDTASPIVPLMLYNPAKIPAFSRECYKRGLAVVVVGYPATPIITSRARFCISAAHTHEDLVESLAKISEVGDILQLKVRA